MLEDECKTKWKTLKNGFPKVALDSCNTFHTGLVQAAQIK